INGFVPTRLRKRPIPYAPAKTLTIIFQLPTPVAINTKAPTKHINVDVSPIDPGIKPMNIFQKLYTLSAQPSPNELSEATASLPVEIVSAAIANGVAPEYPATVLAPSGR